MSKSRGTGISPLRYLEIGMNAEWLRYYIRRQAQRERRGHRLQSRRLHARVNSDLIGKYVNIASRAADFITRQFAGELRYAGDTRALIAEARTLCASVHAGYEAREFGKAMREVMASPIASIRTSTRVSPGCWPRIPRKPRSCRMSARGRSMASRC